MTQQEYILLHKLTKEFEKRADINSGLNHRAGLTDAEMILNNGKAHAYNEAAALCEHIFNGEVEL